MVYFTGDRTLKVTRSDHLTVDHGIDSAVFDSLEEDDPILASMHAIDNQNGNSMQLSAQEHPRSEAADMNVDAQEQDLLQNIYNEPSVFFSTGPICIVNEDDYRGSRYDLYTFTNEVEAVREAKEVLDREVFG
jgi:hypothetical protein